MLRTCYVLYHVSGGFSTRLFCFVRGERCNKRVIWRRLCWGFSFNIFIGDIVHNIYLFLSYLIGCNYTLIVELESFFDFFNFYSDFVDNLGNIERVNKTCLSWEAFPRGSNVFCAFQGGGRNYTKKAQGWYTPAARIISLAEITVIRIKLFDS